ncbi:hypothetical protein FISHEDRAFT_73379 [Fistulina hepatica ATCC 64428]|uniref:Uncharacterized protein n=1 Tax=Fistulina hepatica ATCC 64428 TaxID=1128425 RepID=A0A0D7AE68_9AGAR|nr:hypothetical protein FISHEDRAFT_73379 [Fistulina hepatica ATCC 64428]
MSSLSLIKRLHPHPYPGPQPSPLKKRATNVTHDQDSKVCTSGVLDTQDLCPEWLDPLDAAQEAHVSLVFNKPPVEGALSSDSAASANTMGVSSTAKETLPLASVTEIIDWPSKMPPFQDKKTGVASTSTPKPISYLDLVKTVVAQGHLPGELSQNEKYILSRMRIFCNRELEELNEEGVTTPSKHNPYGWCIVTGHTICSRQQAFFIYKNCTY